MVNTLILILEKLNYLFSVTVVFMYIKNIGLLINEPKAHSDSSTLNYVLMSKL